MMKHLNFLLIAAILGILVLPVILAAPAALVVDVNVTAPASYTNNSGTVLFNVTFSDADMVNAANVTYYANSTVIGTVTFSTRVNSSAGGSLSTTGVTDGYYQIKARIENTSTQIIASINTTNVWIDNTDPVLSCTYTPRSIAPRTRNLNYDCASTTDASSGIATYSIVLTNTRSGTTSTKTTSTGAYVGSDFPSAGRYTIAYTITDFASKQSTRTDTLDVLGSDGSVAQIANEQKGTIIQQETSKKKSNTTVILLIVLVVGTLIVATAYLAKPKKRKR